MYLTKQKKKIIVHVHTVWYTYQYLYRDVEIILS